MAKLGTICLEERLIDFLHVRWVRRGLKIVNVRHFFPWCMAPATASPFSPNITTKTFSFFPSISWTNNGTLSFMPIAYSREIGTKRSKILLKSSIFKALKSVISNTYLKISCEITFPEWITHRNFLLLSNWNFSCLTVQVFSFKSNYCFLFLVANFFRSPSLTIYSTQETRGQW